MKIDTIRERAKQIAIYIADTKCTVREAAKHFCISKSTVHKDISARLPHINYPLYKKIRPILDENMAQRHLRGGIATKNKYLKKQLKRNEK